MLSEEYSPLPIALVHWDGRKFILTRDGPEFMNQVRGGAGVLVANDGRIIDADDFTPLGTAPGFGVPLISAAERIVFRNTGETLRTYDLDTQSVLDESSRLPTYPQLVEGIAA